MSMCDTTLSQKYAKDMGLCKKKIKEAYPKKVCHMLRHVKKKRIKDAYPKKVCHMPRHVKKEKKKKEKIAPYPERKRKERDGTYKGVHTPSTKNIHTLAHLDQGL
jgi:hypothetical protein